MAYEIRNEEGILNAKIDNRMAGKIINEVPGHWSEKNFSGRGKVNVFVMDDDFSWSVGGLKVYLWKGFYLRAD